jgi:hypothetical protein
VNLLSHLSAEDQVRLDRLALRPCSERDAELATRESIFRGLQKDFRARLDQIAAEKAQLLRELKATEVLIEAAKERERLGITLSGTTTQEADGGRT